MRDIESLKQRIEAAEKHNASSELARNRESEALMDMWHQIRTRFTDQEDEIARSLAAGKDDPEEFGAGPHGG